MLLFYSDNFVNFDQDEQSSWLAIAEADGLSVRALHRLHRTDFLRVINYTRKWFSAMIELYEDQQPNMDRPKVNVVELLKTRTRPEVRGFLVRTGLAYDLHEAEIIIAVSLGEVDGDWLRLAEVE